MKKIVFLFTIILLFVIVIDLKNIIYADKNKNGYFEVSEEEGNSYITFPITSTKASSETGLRWETEAYKITMFPKGTQINIDGEEDHINCPIENMKDQIVMSIEIPYDSELYGDSYVYIPIYRPPNYRGDSMILKDIFPDVASGDKPVPILESYVEEDKIEIFNQICLEGGIIHIDPIFNIAYQGEDKRTYNLKEPWITDIPEGWKNKKTQKLSLKEIIELWGDIFVQTANEEWRMRHISMIEFPGKEKFLTTNILRTGTEEGLEKEIYELIVEYDLKNSPQLEAYINNENIVIEGKITIEGGEFVDIGSTYHSGGYTMTKETINQWDASEEKEEIIIPPISIDSNNEGIAWLNKLRLEKEEEQRRMGSHKISKYEDKLYNIEKSDSVKRYMILRWVHDGVSKKVKITSTGVYSREDMTVKDKEIVEIPMNTKELPLFTKGEYSIDYDVRKERFKHEVNGGVPFVAEVKLPERGYRDWDSWWKGNTEGDLSYTLNDSKGLVNNEETIDYGLIDEWSEKIVREPVLIWETDKIDIYGEDLGIENPEERIDKFVINTSGGISRLAGYSYEREYTYTECTTDEDGEEICETHTDYETVYGEEVVSATFPNNQDEVEIQSLFFNGSEMPLRYFGGEIGSYEESSNREEKRILVWEGERYEIPVKRFMRYVDENGETTDIVEEDGYGGNPRTFQHLDEVEVTYKVETSLKDHFKEDREKARNNPNNYKGEIFENAPFATDTNLQRYDYPIKSGYFYRPYGEYIVIVRTTIYKEGGGGTEKHKDIVEQIKESFETNIALPTMQINGDAVIGLDGKQYDEIPVGIEEDYFLEEEYELPYDEGPLSPEEYLYGTEESLLGGTDELYRQILQGWESSESSEYQDMYNYREYVKEGNVYKIVEETVLTFTLNPDGNRYYIVPQTKNGHYNFSIGFKSFDNGYVTVGETIKSIPVKNFDDITFTVVGSMYDDQSIR